MIYKLFCTKHNREEIVDKNVYKEFTDYQIPYDCEF
jgi:hypothetical protein